MNVSTDLDVGAATHTGRVRAVNEDDYLLLVPESDAGMERHGRLFVVADGMGGATGGSEASRIAVRTLAAGFLDDAAPARDPGRRLTEGFERACIAVYEQSVTTPGLAGMGTTMTALWLGRGTGIVGHVGDSRAYRLCDGELVRLTVDHALDSDDSRLTRCIGGGRDSEKVDVDAFRLAVGDRFALVSDGVWGVIGDSGVAAALRRASAQDAADAMIRAALDGGGPDNCTAIVVAVTAVLGPNDALPPARELEISTEELTGTRELPAGRRLRAPRWPWLLFGLAAVLLGWVALRELVGFDPWRWWRDG